MLKKNLRGRKSVFVSWLFSYMLLLLVPIIISALLYTKANDIIEAEVNRVNMITLKQCQQAMDNGLTDVNRLVYQVGINSKIRQLMQVKGEMSYYSSVLQISNDINYYKAVTGFVSDFFIYFHNYNKILTQSGLLESDLYYEGIWKKRPYLENLPYEEWSAIIRGDFSGRYLALGSNEDGGAAGSKAIVYTQSYPINDPSGKEATIVIVLDTKRFMNALESVQSLYNGWGLIVNQNNQVLFSLGPDNKISPNYGDPAKDTDLYNETVDGRKVVISYITSEVSGWRYFSVIPAEIFHSRAVLIRNLTILSLILCLMIGAGAAYYFTKRNYNPIDELIKLIEKRTRVTTEKTGNEFNFIQEVMNETISEKEKIYEKLKRQDAALKANFFQRLVKGKLSDDAFINESLKAYDVHFDEGGSFAVILVYITGFSELFREDENRTTDEKLQLVQFIISNVFEDLTGRRNRSFSAEVDDMLACIVNINSEDPSEGRKELMEIAAEAQEFLLSKFHIHFMVSISLIHKTLMGIPEAYREALTVMEYKTATDSDVIFYDQLKVSKSGYRYTMETEYQLINAVKSADYENASAIIMGIFEDNLTKAALSTEMLRCFSFDMVSTILKIMPELSFVSSDPPLSEGDIVNRLLRCEKLLDMRNEMLKILKELCTHIQQNKRGRKDTFVEEVMQFVKENYSDAGLSVAVIADKFNMTAHYITRLFKEKTGDGLFEYITTVRLEKAKELLKTHDYSVKELASMVGYYNSNVFIRAFKKHAGVTPGMYREIH